MTTITYTVHHRYRKLDATYATSNPVLVGTLRDALARSDHPDLPAYLTTLGITVQRIAEDVRYVRSGGWEV